MARCVGRELHLGTCPQHLNTSPNIEKVLRYSD